MPPSAVSLNAKCCMPASARDEAPSAGRQPEPQQQKDLQPHVHTGHGDRPMWKLTDRQQLLSKAYLPPFVGGQCWPCTPGSDPGAAGSVHGQARDTEARGLPGPNVQLLAALAARVFQSRARQPGRGGMAWC